MGYFEKHGIEIELVQLASGPKILEALGSGSVQIGLTSHVPFIFARAAGIDLVALTGGAVEDTAHREHAILVRADSDIKAVADLSGRIIALNGIKNIDDLMLSELLDSHGVDRASVTVIEIPFPRMETVLQAGDVDAVASIEPLVTRAVMRGTARVLTYNYVELHPRIPIACYVAEATWINENEELVNNFISAFDEATDYCLAKESSLIEIIAKYTSISTDELTTMQLPTFNKRTNRASLQQLIEKMTAMNLIQEHVSVDEMIYEF